MLYIPKFIFELLFVNSVHKMTSVKRMKFFNKVPLYMISLRCVTSSPYHLQFKKKLFFDSNSTAFAKAEITEKD